MPVTAPPAAPQNAPHNTLHNELPVGTRLGEFEIRAVLGVGGFGIVYRAFDHALEREVAIKEYMPGALAARSATLQVSVLSQGHVETFELGLNSFVGEARLLARFDHPSLVKVLRFWRANGTAYMAMPLYRGRTLKAVRQEMREAPSEKWLLGLLEPLLGALETLHAENVFHRDVSPDNILVGDDGRPVLLDFGAARHVIGDQSQALTTILKPNFAPIEQYGEANGLRQGPWTDLYALGATLFFVVTGTPPQPSTARALGSGVESLAGLRRPGLSMDFLRAVDWMMAPRPEHRPKSVAALRTVFEGRRTAPDVSSRPTPLDALGTSWEQTVVHDPEAPDARDLSATMNLRSIIDAGAQPRPAPAPPSQRYKATERERRRAHRRRRRAGLMAVLTVVAGGAAAWVFEPWQYLEPAAQALVAAIESREAAPAPPAAPRAVPRAATPAAVATPDAAPDGAISNSPSAEGAAPNPVATTTAPESAAPAVRKDSDANAKTRPLPRRPAKPAAEPDAAAGAVPAPPDPAATLVSARSPSELCRGRLALAWYRCVKRACDASPAIAGTHECQRVRQIEADNARLRDR